MTTTVLTIGDRIVISKCWIADSFVNRLVGLMGRPGLTDDEAMLFPRCNSIHTFWMKFPIDVVFLAGDGRVFEVVERVKPWRVCLPRFRSSHVLELKAHRFKELGCTVGTFLSCEGVW